jgi:anaerobic selenocysteine-containing dehydrogenase
MPNPGVLSEDLPRPAQVIPPEFLPPMFSIGKGPASRFHGLYQVCGEMSSTTLSDEILEPGEGQIRALITAGANPAVAMPDQDKMLRALDSLELSVCVDVEMSATARRCEYVIAARHILEREDVTEFMDMFYEVPYAFYTKAAIQPENDFIEDWELFVGLAKRLDFSIELPGGTIDPVTKPTKLEVLKLLKPNPRVALEDIRAKGRGHIFEDLDVSVEAPIPGMEARLQLAPEGICGEIGEVYAETGDSKQCAKSGAAFTHLLICRRLRHVINSYGQTYPELRKKGTTNYAYMNEADLEQLGLSAGDLIEIESDHGAIIGVVQPTDEVKGGVISMSHCWGDTPDQGLDVREFGVNTNRLIKTDKDFDSITGMARMSAIPVAVRPHVG